MKTIPSESSSISLSTLTSSYPISNSSSLKRTRSISPPLGSSPDKKNKLVHGPPSILSSEDVDANADLDADAEGEEDYVTEHADSDSVIQSVNIDNQHTPTDGNNTSSPLQLQQHPSDDDYANGTVVCDKCGKRITFRDKSGGFSVELWNIHTAQCHIQTQMQTQLVTSSPPIHPHDSLLHAPDPSQSIAFDTTSNMIPHTQAHTLTYPSSSASISASYTTSKKRRAKRTEQERIEYLSQDQYVAKFEAYRVLCGSCNKWIRLRPNSTYCSIPWDAHRKSCLSKKANAKSHIQTQENTSNHVNNYNDYNNSIKLHFQNDIYVKNIDLSHPYLHLHPRSHSSSQSQPQSSSVRVLCAICEEWISIRNEDEDSNTNVTNSDADADAVQAWVSHREECLIRHRHRHGNLNATGSGDGSPVIGQSNAVVASTSTSSTQSHPRTNTNARALAHPEAPPHPSLLTLTPLRPNLIPGSKSEHNKSPPPHLPASLSPHLSLSLSLSSSTSTYPPPLAPAPAPTPRHQSATQRQQTLLADPYLLEVEPNRVFCKICRKWVQLRQDSSFCAYPWVQHRGKCLRRMERNKEKVQLRERERSLVERSSTTRDGTRRAGTRSTNEDEYMVVDEEEGIVYRYRYKDKDEVEDEDEVESEEDDDDDEEEEEEDKDVNILGGRVKLYRGRGRGRESGRGVEVEYDDDDDGEEDGEEDGGEDEDQEAFENVNDNLDMNVEFNSESMNRTRVGGGGGGGGGGNVDVNANANANANAFHINTSPSLILMKKRSSSGALVMSKSKSRTKSTGDLGRGVASISIPIPVPAGNLNNGTASGREFEGGKGGKYNNSSANTNTNANVDKNKNKKNEWNFDSNGVGVGIGDVGDIGTTSTGQDIRRRYASVHQSQSQSQDKHTPIHTRPRQRHRDDYGHNHGHGHGHTNMNDINLTINSPRSITRSPVLHPYNGSGRGRGTGRGSAISSSVLGLADLDNSPGRIQFISDSIKYLFGTTYEETDDMTVSSLLTYLNAAMPVDKHEDFDYAEVRAALGRLEKERGEVRVVRVSVGVGDSMQVDGVDVSKGDGDGEETGMEVVRLLR